MGIAAVGMYFICINEGFSINKGDFYTLICAVCFAAQIIAVDKVIANLDGVRLSLVQSAQNVQHNSCAKLPLQIPGRQAIMISYNE